MVVDQFETDRVGRFLLAVRSRPAAGVAPPLRRPCATPSGAANPLQRLALWPLRRFFDDLKAGNARRA